MIVRRIYTVLGALALPATLLVAQAPAAHASTAGPCPAGFVSVGDHEPDPIGGLGTIDIKFNRDTQMWCFQTSAPSDSSTSVQGRPASWNENWAVGAEGTGTIHIGWKSNGGKCADAKGVVSRRTQQESKTITRCRA